MSRYQFDHRSMMDDVWGGLRSIPKDQIGNHASCVLLRAAAYLMEYQEKLEKSEAQVKALLIAVRSAESYGTMSPDNDREIVCEMLLTLRKVLKQIGPESLAQS